MTPGSALRRSNLKVGKGIHANPAFLKMVDGGEPPEWVHLVYQNSLPPTGPGSYTYLLWDIQSRRAGRDVVICDYSPAAARLARESELPIVQIDWAVAEGSLTRRETQVLRRLRVGGAARRDWAARRRLSAVPGLLRAVGCGRLVIWGAMDHVPALRRLLPDDYIVFAQRHFEYPRDRMHYNDCDFVVFQLPSQITRAFDVATQLNPGSVVIPNGVETDVFSPRSSAERARLRAHLKLPPDSPIVVFPSKLAAYKGTALLLQWVEGLPDLHFLVVGTAHRSLAARDRARVETVLRSAPNVTWLNGVDRARMPDLLGCADICIMPATWREGFSMAALEAMASGLPLIATDAGCYRDLVIDGITGILCPIESLGRSGRDALRLLAASPDTSRQMGAAARGFVERSLTRERCVTNWCHFLQGDVTAIDAALDRDEHEPGSS